MKQSLKIAVMGMGGTGCHMINKLVNTGVTGIDFIAVDVGCSCSCLAEHQVNFSDYSKPFTEKAMKKQEQAGLSKIKKMLDKVEMVIIVCDSAPFDGAAMTQSIAKVCRSMGILTIVMTQNPLEIENKNSRRMAKDSQKRFKQAADAVIILPSDSIIKNTGIKRFQSIKSMYSIIEDYFVVSIKSVVDLFLKPGEVQASFSDVKKLFKNSGVWGIGIGQFLAESDSGVKTALNVAKKAFGTEKLKKVKKLLFTVTTPKEELPAVELAKAQTLVNNMVKKKMPYIRGTIDDEIRGYSATIKVAIIGMYSGK